MSGIASSIETAGGALVPTSITQGTLAAAIWVLGNMEASGRPASVTTGALTANTLATVLSVTGRGALGFLLPYGNDATSRTHRVKITLDGNVIYDKTSGAVATANQALPVVGTPVLAYNGSSVIWTASETLIFYEQSLLVEYASSLTETGKTTFKYINYLR